MLSGARSCFHLSMMVIIFASGSDKFCLKSWVNNRRQQIGGRLSRVIVTTELLEFGILIRMGYQPNSFQLRRLKESTW
jgi:hypothetical protein